MNDATSIALSGLQEEMRTCLLCVEAGYTVTPGAIFSHPPAAKVLLIGQAPGITEVEARRPFNAGSGKRLFRWLEKARWHEVEFRNHYAMTAVTKCYPGKDKNGKGDRLPSKLEQRFCRPFLEREIALFRPRLIILVGGLAIRLFYPPTRKLSAIIGTACYFPPTALTDPVNFNLSQAKLVTEFDETKRMDGRWVVPLPHPSGASLWPNKPENQALIDRAIVLLSQIRQAWSL